MQPQTKTLSMMMREMNERFEKYHEKLLEGVDKNLSAGEIFANHDLLTDRTARAVNAGALAAIKKAYQTGTNLLVWRDGKMAEITPEEAEVNWLESSNEEDSS